MNRRTRFLAHAAVIAALYAALAYGQNLLLPGTTSMAIQFRVCEALCVLAFFTPSAVAGLTAGCLLFNISYAHTLPLDFLLGTAATYLSVQGMYLTRRMTVKEYPLLGLLLPVFFNALLVGWELSLYVGGGFWLNALYIAIGEAAVMLTLGSVLYYTIKARHLDSWLING